jgi:hypothetical protein
MEPTIEDIIAYQLPIRPQIGARVQIPTHYDAWMRGARYGVVTSYGPGAVGRSAFVRVQLDRLPNKRLKVWRMDWNYIRPVVTA